MTSGTPTTLASGRYVLEQRLGSGGMSLVYRARDTQLHRTVAVKLLADNLAADPEARERFLREARAAGRLNHPNIVQVHDVGEDGGRPWMVMEYVDGPSLDEVVARAGPLDPDAVAGIAAEVAAAVHYAHEAGVVHRDVKPSNVIRSSDGTVKIGDFGVAEAAGLPSLTRTGIVLGTPGYLAPERRAGEAASPAADLYGLGAMLHELLTGAPPPVGSREDRTPPPLPPGVPQALAAVVRDCLARDPAGRPASAAAVVERLAGAAAGGAAPGRAPAGPGTPDTPPPATAGPPASGGGSTRAPDRTRPLTVRRAAETRRVGAAGPRAGGNGDRGPHTRRRWRAAAAAALVVAALLVALVVADQGGDTDGGGGQEPGAEEVTRIPRSDDPSEQARLLAEWLHEQAGG